MAQNNINFVQMSQKHVILVCKTSEIFRRLYSFYKTCINLCVYVCMYVCMYVYENTLIIEYIC